MALTDFHTHTYITTGGNEKGRKAHYVHSVKFYDNEEDTPVEQEDDGYVEETLEEKPVDLLHLGNYEGAVLQDSGMAMDEYNDQLLKYNSKFSQLVGKLHSNLNSVN